MKRLIAVLVLFALSMCLLSCSYRGTYDDGYTEGYADGYSDAESDMYYLMEEEFLDGYDIGYEDGYHEGIADAQHDIANRLEDDLSSLAWDIEDEYGLFPEDALRTLSNYADVPDEVGKDEVTEAIWAICHYYYKSYEITNGIEDYLID